MDHDRTIDLSRDQTFAWKPGTPAQSDLIQQRIVSGIEGQLAAKGLRLASGKPDLWVDAHAMTETEIRSSSVSVGLGFHKRTKRGASASAARAAAGRGASRSAPWLSISSTAARRS